MAALLLAALNVFHLNRGWLVAQSLLVVAGSTGAFIGLFSLVTVGILAGLVLVTPVGLLTFLPSLWMLVLVISRHRAFVEFAPHMRTRIPYEDLEREFDRIGADVHLRSGLASTDPRLTMDLVLAALRATPTRGGTAGFERTLKAMLDAPGERR
jgi:hypothetical protein